MHTQQTLAAQEEAWQERPVVRRLYLDWFRRIARDLSRVEGPTVELGAGIGHFREVVPHAVLTDVEATRWSDDVVDAENLPYDDAGVANLVLVDVFHHLSHPARFLDEAVRTLAPGGRILILDPYCSTLSTWAYRRFHHERTDLEAPAFDEDPAVAASAFASNQARATLAFFRSVPELARRWPQLALVRRERLAFVLYPLSGGFSRPPLVPEALYAPLAGLEAVLRPLAPLLAFRCFVVLER